MLSDVSIGFMRVMVEATICGLFIGGLCAGCYMLVVIVVEQVSAWQDRYEAKMRSGRES